MGQARTSMHNIRRIIEMHEFNHLSDRMISKLTGVSRPTIGQYLSNWRQSNLDLETFRSLSDSDALDILTLGSRKTDPRLLAAMAVFPSMAHELSRVGVTRETIWNEYRQNHPSGYTYSRFCYHYQVWRGTQPDHLSMHFEHKAGELAYFDWAGKLPLRITNPKTGIQTTPEVFVSILGASQFTYVEATLSQELPHWINACRHAFEYFQGVPAGLVPDAYKGAVTKACKYEPINNQTFADFATHYGTVVLPARPYKPKDKALVEGAVKIIYSRLFAPLHNRTFHSLREINEALWEFLSVHNARKFQRLDATRHDLWQTIDRPALKPLPVTPYEYRQFKMQKVPNDYHIRIKERDGDHCYSVPWQLFGKSVQIEWTTRTVEVYHNNLREAFHCRVPGRGWTTRNEHMPDDHRFVASWTPQRIQGWARAIGPSVEMQCQRIMQRFEHPEHGYKSCIGLIGLAKRYGNLRVDGACALALDRQVYGYRVVKNILVSDQDKIVPLPLPVTINHENLRGQSAYS